MARKQRKIEDRVRKQFKSITNKIYYMYKKGKIVESEYETAKSRLKEYRRQQGKSLGSLSAKQLRDISKNIATYDFDIRKNRKSVLEEAIRRVQFQSDYLGLKKMTIPNRRRIEVLEKRINRYKELSDRDEFRMEDLTDIEFAYSEADLNSKNAIRDGFYGVLASFEKIISISGKDMDYRYDIIDRIKEMHPQQFMDMYFDNQSIRDLMFKYIAYVEASLNAEKGNAKDYDDALSGLCEEADSVFDVLDKILKERGF